MILLFIIFFIPTILTQIHSSPTSLLFANCFKLLQNLITIYLLVKQMTQTTSKYYLFIFISMRINSSHLSYIQAKAIFDIFTSKLMTFFMLNYSSTVKILVISQKKICSIIFIYPQLLFYQFLSLGIGIFCGLIQTALTTFTY